MPVVTEANLNEAVDALTKNQPIATATDVQAWLAQRGVDWDGNKRNGKHLERVDRERMAASRPLRLQKWKAPGGKNAPVGWATTASLAAERWAAAHGWDRLDLIDGRWTRVDENGKPL